MKPSEVSRELRRIATGIDRCKKPVRPDLVSRDLRRVLVAVDKDPSQMTDEEFEAWRATLPDEDNLIPAEEMIGFFVKSGSFLEQDAAGDSEAGIKFTNLLEQAGLGNVHWEADSVSFIHPRGLDRFAPLVQDIQSGKHGPDMVSVIDSLESPGYVKVNMNGTWAEDPLGDNEYYL